jgi:hypothetical protein
MLPDGSLKIFARKKLEQLAKNAAKSFRIHQGLASFGCLVFSTKHLQDHQPFFGLFHAPPQKLIWTDLLPKGEGFAS